MQYELFTAPADLCADAPPVIPHVVSPPVISTPADERVPSVSMSLQTEPASDRVSLAISDLATWLHKLAGRNRQPTGPYLSALAAMLRDLLNAASKRPFRPCYRPMALGEFTGHRIGYKPFRRVLADLEARKLVTISKGWGNPAAIHARSGVVTRIYPTDRLLKRLAVYGLLPDQIATDFRKAADAELIPQPIRLSGTKQRKEGAASKRPAFAKAIAMPVNLTDDRVKALADQVRQINNFWSKQTLEGADHEGFYRQFNMGDDPAFNWNKGGRLISLGGGYQNMEQDDRKGITINGQSTVELDISASHLTIYHALAGEPLASDPYTISGLPRHIVKTWVLITLGHDKFHRQWTPRAKEKMKSKFGIDSLQATYPIRVVQKMVLEHIPLLNKWESSPYRWGDFQHIESNIILESILDLIDKGVPSLPIHDSLTVPENNLQIARNVLANAFQRNINVIPTLTIK